MMQSDDRSLLYDLQDVKHIFADKWTIAVLIALRHGPLRRSQILRIVDSYDVDKHWPGRASGLHDSILTRTLRKLVAEGLVRRDEMPDSFPRHVRYAIEPPARDFVERARCVTGWTQQNREVVLNARNYAREHSASFDEGYQA